VRALQINKEIWNEDDLLMDLRGAKKHPTERGQISSLWEPQLRNLIEAL